MIQMTDKHYCITYNFKNLVALRESFGSNLVASFCPVLYKPYFAQISKLCAQRNMQK
jgi:hypothetical protein